jgi:predicted Zn-dependent protease
MAPRGRSETYRGRTLSTTRSFAPLTEEERNSTSAVKLRYTEARPGETIQRLSKRSGNAWNVSDTAIYNAIFVDHIFKGGELVKISKSERYTPGPIPR